VPGAGPRRPAPKKSSLVASERDEVKRAAWRAAAAALDPAALVFVDETSTHISLTRSHARAPRGVRAIGRVPRNHDPRLSLVATLRLAGIGEAALALPGAVDGAAFTAFVEQELTPRLRPGQVVVMDNLSVHKGARVQELIEAAGCRLLFLPAYSPDFAPIEQAFSKLKAHLRGVGARTQERLEAAIGEALAHITPADARGWFTHCGYLVPGQ
jgi:transposase